MSEKTKKMNVIQWFMDMRKNNELFSTGVALIVMVILQTIALGFDYPNFGSWFTAWFNNWMNILRNNSSVGIIALGMTFVIISGGIDLAVGSTVVAIGAVVMALIDANTGGWLGVIGLTGVPAFIAAIIIAIIFDVGCIKDGYCSDMTRSFYYKTVTDEHRVIYEAVKNANEAAIAKIKPGVPLKELDLAARDLITAQGYGPNFNHRLGHFIGLSEHEFGDVSSVNETLAAPGMIFSIEPGIYITGDTGVRIEDLVLVTEDGCEVLNHFPKELEVLG